MQTRETAQGGNVLSLDVARERRRFIDLAGASENWEQVKASFALEGIALTDDDAERAGRIFAGVLTHDQAIEEICCKYRVTRET